jgi:thiosulfate reductase cytochrome b subunit
MLLLTLITHIIMAMIQIVFVIHHLTLAYPRTPSINNTFKYDDDYLII